MKLPFPTGEKPKKSFCLKWGIHETPHKSKGQRAFQSHKLIYTSVKAEEKIKKLAQTQAGVAMTTVMVLSKLLPEVSAPLSPSSADSFTQTSSSLKGIIQHCYLWKKMKNLRPRSKQSGGLWRKAESSGWTSEHEVKTNELSTVCRRDSLNQQRSGVKKFY